MTYQRLWENNIVTNVRVAWLVNTWVSDLLDTRRLQILWLQFTVALSPIHTIAISSLEHYRYFPVTVYSL
jgi:hypothetical protein